MSPRLCSENQANQARKGPPVGKPSLAGSTPASSPLFHSFQLWVGFLLLILASLFHCGQIPRAVPVRITKSPSKESGALPQPEETKGSKLLGLLPPVLFVLWQSPRSHFYFCSVLHLPPGKSLPTPLLHKNCFLILKKPFTFWYIPQPFTSFWTDSSLFVVLQVWKKNSH